MTDQRTDVALRDEGGGQAVGIPIEQRMAMLREALTNPAVDPQKAVAMADLMFKLEDRDRQAEFNRDLIAAKQEIPPIYKRGKNTHQGTSYGKMEDIQRVVDPILARHNLSIDYKIGSEGAMLTVKPVLRHRNGWVEVGEAIKGPPDEGPGRSKIQSVGSSSSYLQRYAAKAALNLRFDGEDDDGVGGRLNDVPNDRQQQLVIDAQEAVERGEYGGWYQRQKPKDKAWLVSIGTHARLGGGSLLPGPEDAPEAAEERRSAPPPPPPPPAPPPPSPPPPPAENGELGLDQSGGQRKRQLTPREWVDTFRVEVERCRTTDELDLYLDRKSDALVRLEKSDPTLHAEATKAHRDRRAKLTE